MNSLAAKTLKASNHLRISTVTTVNGEDTSNSSNSELHFNPQQATENVDSTEASQEISGETADPDINASGELNDAEQNKTALNVPSYLKTRNSVALVATPRLTSTTVTAFSTLLTSLSTGVGDFFKALGEGINGESIYVLFFLLKVFLFYGLPYVGNGHHDTHTLTYTKPQISVGTAGY